MSVLCVYGLCVCVCFVCVFMCIVCVCLVCIWFVCVCVIRLCVYVYSLCLSCVYIVCVCVFTETKKNYKTEDADGICVGVRSGGWTVATVATPTCAI